MNIEKPCGHQWVVTSLKRLAFEPLYHDVEIIYVGVATLSSPLANTGLLMKCDHCTMTTRIEIELHSCVYVILYNKTLTNESIKIYEPSSPYLFNMEELEL